MNVLAVGCHPDDVEIGCAGTLAKCVQRGDKVTVCHVANGNMGHEIIKPDELRIIRANEKLPIDKEAASQANAVRLMTVHGSKGLEFPVCFVCHCDSSLKSALNADARRSIPIYAIFILSSPFLIFSISHFCVFVKWF